MVHIIMYVIAFIVLLFCVAAELNIFVTGIIGTVFITVYYIAYYSIKSIMEGKPILKVRRPQEPESGGKEEQQPIPDEKRTEMNDEDKDKEQQQDRKYTLSDSGTEAVIFDGVKEIDDRTFADCTDLETVVIPESVECIGRKAFSGCKSLREINLPKSLREIKAEAFCGCENIERIIVPDSVYMISDNAFERCRGLKEISLPEKLLYLGEEAFRECNKLTRIHLPDSLLSIGNRAFAYCSCLEEVYLPEHMMCAGGEIFKGCNQLDREKTEAWEKRVNVRDELPGPAGEMVSVLYGYRFYFGKETELAHNQQNTFWFEGKKLTFDIFRCKPELEFGENIWKFRDTEGNAVLAVYYSVPTFDSDDREWDSYGIYYIIQYNGRLCAIRKRGGYRLAKVSYFDNVYCADTRTVQFMETIGMTGRQFVI